MVMHAICVILSVIWQMNFRRVGNTCNLWQGGHKFKPHHNQHSHKELPPLCRDSEAGNRHILFCQIFEAELNADVVDVVLNCSSLSPFGIRD